MSEKPILFSGPMVRAILEGRKTQTRRVAKLNYAGRVQLGGKQWHVEDPNAILACPYGQLGDRLWVRETWTSGYHGGAWGTIYKGDSAFIYGKRQHSKGPHFHATEIGPHIKWRPSIFMPRWASRITLEITGVRVQQLQDISEDDAKAEGPSLDGGPWIHGGRHETYRAAFFDLWDSINAKRGFSWASNPWVWALTFKRIDGGPQ